MVLVTWWSAGLRVRGWVWCIACGFGLPWMVVGFDLSVGFGCW